MTKIAIQRFRKRRRQLYLREIKYRKECRQAMESLRQEELMQGRPEWAKTINQLVPTFYALGILSVGMAICAKSLKNSGILE